MSDKLSSALAAVENDLEFYTKELEKQAAISGRKLLELSRKIREGDMIRHADGLQNTAVTLQSLLDDVIVLRNIRDSLK